MARSRSRTTRRLVMPRWQATPVPTATSRSSGSSSCPSRRRADRPRPPPPKGTVLQAFAAAEPECDPEQSPW
eukprot:3430506-Alexandrium_andersonii.AAC.1